MSKARPKQTPAERAERVFVSAFLTNHVLEARADDDAALWTLTGAGLAKWETDGNAISMSQADLFIIAQWIGAARGGYTITVDIRDSKGVPISRPIHSSVLEVSDPEQSYSLNVPLTGVVIPVGQHFLWVCVDDIPKAPISLLVYGPDE